MTILHRAMTIGLGVALLGSISPGFSGAAQAQQQWTTQQGVNGYNVTQANFSDGVFRQTGNGRWTEFNASGRATYSFTETGRDEWSVYLDDQSRNVQLQLDLFRKWVGYGQNGSGKSDLYRIRASSPRQIAYPPPRRAPRPVSNTRNVNAGPIWNQQDAQRKCPAVAASQGGEWTGQWRTTVQGKMSVCEIRF